jgi:hypothetical protein
LGSLGFRASFHSQPRPNNGVGLNT